MVVAFGCGYLGGAIASGVLERHSPTPEFRVLGLRVQGCQQAPVSQLTQRLHVPS